MQSHDMVIPVAKVKNVICEISPVRRRKVNLGHVMEEDFGFWTIFYWV